MKFATEYWPETFSRVEFFPSDSKPDLPVTAVKVYVFQDNSLLLTYITRRGWDLPGGHIEVNETPETAAVRELKEETGATIETLRLVGYLKVTNEEKNEQNKKYPEVSCVLVYRGYDVTIHESHVFQLEATESEFVSLNELPRIHHEWNEAKAQVMEYVRNNE